MGDAHVEQLFLTGNQMLRRGLRLVGVPTDVQERRGTNANVRVFKSHFGPHPNHCATVWKQLLTTDVAEAKVLPEQVDLKAFFMALHHVRVYLTDDQRNPTFNNMDFQKMASDTWWWVQRIAALHHQVIVFPTEAAWGGTAIILSIDGTHMSINEPCHPDYRVDTSYFSHKHRTAGFNVQVVLKIYEPDIIGPFLSGYCQ